ncbi:MAG: hypothetical protein IIY33_00245 [Erysipelotrichaceae bacterium]|nr:hypothetical protein [Erysipelotrichaceae bacterium]
MPDPVYFSRVKLLDGSYAEVKDAVARAAIGGATHFIGVTTTALTDGQTISQVTIGGETVTLKNGDLMLYGSKEFIFASADGKVHELGDTTGLGALAYKSEASGSFTPQGSVSKPDIDVTPTTETVAAFKTAGSVTAGSANVPTAVAVTPGTANTPTAVTVQAGSANTPTAVEVTAGSANVPTAVTLPTLTTSLNGETLELGWSAGSVTPGSAGTPTAVSVTPGVASVPTAVSVTPGVAAVPTSVSVTPGTASVPTAVTLPTSENVSVVTGVAAELHEAPDFTGTAGTVTVS